MNGNCKEWKIARASLPVAAVFLSEAGQGRFSVELRDIDPMTTLVIDVYPSVSPRHPQRHLGWFQFADLAEGVHHFRFFFQADAVNVAAESGMQPVASWVNEAPERQDLLPLSLRVVLRNKLNNQILFEDAMIVYATPEQFQDDKRYFEQPQAIVPRGLPFQPVLDPKRVVAIVVRELRDYDAIGYFCWESWALLQANGIEARLYVGRCDDKFRPFVRNVHELLDEADWSSMTLFYQLSIYDPSLEWLCRLPCAKVAFFHGITNPDHLRVFDGELALACSEGMRQLPLLAWFDRVIANSRFSREVLMEKLPVGSSLPEVLPPLATLASGWQSVESEAESLQRFSGDAPLILYVGRLFPNKRVADLLAVFERYVRLEPDARLVLVGGAHNSYQRYLEYKIGLMDEAVARQIIFSPVLSKAGLKAVYQRATCFVTMSEHEGFGIPVLEAMYFGVPVIARHCTAIPEVLEGAGKLFRKYDPDMIAREIHRLHSDPLYRQQVIARQNCRVADFADDRLAVRLIESITGWETEDEGFI